MKKIILAATVISSLTTFSFKSAETLENPVNCGQWAQQQCIIESGTFGAMSRSEYAQAYTFYYNHCMDSGGYPGDPTIL